MIKIPHNKLYISKEDRAAVDAVLTSGWIAQGEQVITLEEKIVNLYGGGAACAVSSGTSALYLALKSLGINKKSKVAVPAYTCSALLNAINMCNATPILIDVSENNFCINIDGIKKCKDDISCIIVVHTYGVKADVESLKTIGVPIIEDCCHSIGGYEGNMHIGKQGDIAIFSFYATKPITGGQGGLIWSKDIGVIDFIKDYRQFDCRENYSPRFNLQMTDIQAALINSQLLRLEDIRLRRQYIVSKYAEVLPAKFKIQEGILNSKCMPYRFVITAPNQQTRDGLRDHLLDAGIGCAVPIEQYELLSRYLLKNKDEFPVSEKLANTTLSLPLYPSIRDVELRLIQEKLLGFNC